MKNTEYGHKHLVELEYLVENRMYYDWLVTRSCQDKLTDEEYGVWTQTPSRIRVFCRKQKVS